MKYAVRSTQYLYLLSLLYLLDRALKTAAVAHFFAQTPPSSPLPTLTLLQPITRGATSLPAALEARANLNYPTPIQHLMVCDTHDSISQGICRAWLSNHPTLHASIITIDSPTGIASKTAKLQTGLAHATNNIVCCVDDDVILRPNALQTMIPYLTRPGTGAVFGLACYTDWSNLPSSLMSAFVNSNALLTYIPGTYLTDPFTITGHIFAVRRATLESVGGFDALENNIADDHILAEKIRNAHLRIVQTPMIYDVQNHFTTLTQYASQMKRWFVFPRQALIPLMSPHEQALTLALSLANMIPPILLLTTLLTRKRSSLSSFLQTLLAFNLTHILTEKLYLKRSTPLHRLPLLTLTALLTPIQIVTSLLSNNEIEWRGRRLKIHKGGTFTDINTP